MTWHESYLVLGVFLGLVGTFSAILITRHYQKKQFDRDGLIRIFDLLSNEKNKKIRHQTYRAFCEKKISEDGELLSSDYRLAIEESRTTFGQIGRLVNEGYVNKDIFLKTYSGVVIRLWKSLEKNIQRERRIRKMSNYLMDFENLYNDAVKFWKSNYTESLPEPCNEKTIEDSKLRDSEKYKF